MANHISAQKRHRQSLDRAQHNRWWKSRVKTVSRSVADAVAKKDKKGAQASLCLAMTEIGKARREGVLHKNNAARRMSRLSKIVSSLRA